MCVVVQIYSVSLKKWVHMLRFRSRIHAIATSAHHLLVALDAELHVYRCHPLRVQFDFLFSTRCYPNPGLSLCSALLCSTLWV
jgi:hypothetical protein